jgi:hypothetical protein
LAIVVARRSWLEISGEKLGKAGKKKKSKGKKEKRKKRKEKKEKKREGIKTAELDRRDQVTATKSWPNFPSREGNRGRLSGSSTY